MEMDEKIKGLLVTIKSLKDYIKLSKDVEIHKQIMEENWRLRMDKLRLEKELRELKGNGASKNP